MKRHLIALGLAIAPAIALTAVATPASAQTRYEEMRFREAQARFDREREIYERERARYEDARRRGGRGAGYRDRYRDDSYGYDERYGWRRDDSRDWEPSRYYREDPRYEERRLSAQDEVYRGSDGRYYCRRSDGTTGLVIGAGAGALLGRGIDTRGERTTGTVVGGVLGALLGREVERSQDIRCR